MVVGRTHSSISKPELFNRFSETEILLAVFPNIKQLPCLICSPLREDRHPSFSIYVNKNGHICYKDFADNGEQGSLMDLLCKYWNCTFRQCLSKLSGIISNNSSITIKSSPAKILTLKGEKNNIKLQVVVRTWQDYDYQYWSSYGIEKKWLHYAEIYPISHKIVIKKDSTGQSSRYIFPADQYAYCFVERKEGKLTLKIYQPFNKSGYKWSSEMDSSVIGLWTKIPEKGDRVVICSSLKDALCLSCQLHIPALCLQGEGYRMSDTAVAELKKRYKKVCLRYYILKQVRRYVP
mgnify:CR=1 FL=1